MSDTYRIVAMSTALSPVSHMSGTEGNEAILNRECVMTETGRRFVPVLSGNAIRHRMIREPAGLHLIHECGLAGKINKRAANFFLHGGSLSESTARVDLNAKMEMKERMPFVRLIGGALPDAIEEGSLRVDQGVLCCRENASRIGAISGLGAPSYLRSAEDFVGGWQYTRSDAARNEPDVIDRRQPDDDESNLMIYSGQNVIPGATFIHGFTLEHAGPLEVGCLLMGISLWLSAGGHIGGMASRGHGKLDTRLLLPDGIDGQLLIDTYIEHVRANVEWVAAWTERTFSSVAKQAKATKAKKGAINVGDATLEGIG